MNKPLSQQHTVSALPETDTERGLSREILGVVEAAALAAGRLMGRGDRHAADQEAVSAMREVLNQIPFKGTIVIGEGERDEAPMLYIGEHVGLYRASGTAGQTPGPVLDLAPLDIAVDPLEGTNLLALGLPGAVATLALSTPGGLFHAPDTYMEKLVVGPQAKGKVSINAPVADNLRILADCLDRPVSDLTVVILDRPRHETLITAVRQAGARIKLISDGDMMPAISAAMTGTGIHAVMGTGGAPEAVLSAAALKCLGGEIQGHLRWRSPEEKARAIDMGLADPSEEKIYTTEDLAPGNQIVFAACGMTSGDLLQGVRYFGTGARTHSLIMAYKLGLVRFVDTIHVNRSNPGPLQL